jgi:hypothetical protein
MNTITMLATPGRALAAPTDARVAGSGWQVTTLQFDSTTIAEAVVSRSRAAARRPGANPSSTSAGEAHTLRDDH